MGKHKFRLSDMIPRAWLRKLKTSGSTLTNPRALLPTDRKDDDDDRPLSPLDQAHQRKSYHFSRQFDTVQPRHPPSPPRRSTNKQRRSVLLRRPTRRSIPRRVTAAVSSSCRCRTLADFDPVRAKPECRFPISPSSSLSSTDAVFPLSPPSFGHSLGSVPSSESFDLLLSWTTTSSSCRCRADLDGSVTLEEGFDRDPLFEYELELKLPAVITKPPEFNEMVMNSRRQEENKKLIAASSSLELPAFITNPPEFNEMVMNSRRQEENKKPIAASSSLNSTSAVLVKVVEEDTHNRTVRANKEQKKPRLIGNSDGSPAGGMRLRVNSPKLVTRKLNQARLQGRKSTSVPASFRPGTNLGSKARKSGVSNGFAVVKSSVDPGKDFRKSMVEMIVENDIRASKDLEELLACYLMLNSDEYHNLIVGVFKQIWFDFYGAHSK